MTETICSMAIADQSNREKEIFEQALDITPAEERLRFLTNACGQDAALLARVQALLRADESGESFLPEQPKATVGAITEKPGARIGRYKLLRCRCSTVGWNRKARSAASMRSGRRWR